MRGPKVACKSYAFNSRYPDVTPKANAYLRTCMPNSGSKAPLHTRAFSLLSAPGYRSLARSPKRHVSFGYGKEYNKSNEVTELGVKSFLQAKNVKARSGPTCFKCENVLPPVKDVSGRPGRKRKEEFENMTLYVNKTTGHFFCTDTWHRGSWKFFKECLNLPRTKPLETSLTEHPDEKFVTTSDLGRAKKIWEENSVKLSELPDLSREQLLTELKIDAIPYSELELFNIRSNAKADSLLVPWFPATNQIGLQKTCARENLIGLKVISVDRESKPSFRPRYGVTNLPQKNYWPLLGLGHIPPNRSSVILTTNEFDAIALNAFSVRHKAVSLPSGLTHVPLEVLPFLEQFSEIILWFDNDLVSWEAARHFSKKLNEKRCRIVRPTAGSPSPLQALSRNLDMDKILSAAVSAEIKNIVSFTDLRGFVKDELMNSETVCGVKWQRYPHITSKLKGHRRGEVTVLTGPTGSGKTTFMSEYSLDLAMQGVSTLWGSFEIQNVRLIKTMMKQFARSKLENHMTNFEEIANKFQTLPIHFMTYNGPQNIKDVIHTMRQAAYVHDIQHIVIDNLQFMMGTMSKNIDRFTMQDMLIGEFRHFATAEHIHVTVVIHPRKEDSGIPLQIASIFGTAKATQESDNVMILQQVQNYEGEKRITKNYLEIAKNRYDGELGKVSLRFDRNTLCMSRDPVSETTKEPFSLDELNEGDREEEDIADEQSPKTKDFSASSADGSTPSWFHDWQANKYN